MDFEVRTVETLDRAISIHPDHVDDAGRDSDFYLRVAQIYATLAVAQQISRYPSPPSYIEVKR